MSTQLLILPLPDGEQAVLCLSRALTPASLPALERELRAGLATLRHELNQTSPTPGEQEYASWTPGTSH